MEITIFETGEKQELSIIDSKSGVDWINDLMGNHNELPNYNDDDDIYQMTQESYNWWATLTKDLQAAEDRCDDVLNNLIGDKYDNMINDLHYINCDLEDAPNYMQSICNEYDNKS